MPLLIENFAKQNSISAIWKIDEPKSFFEEKTELSNEDKKLIRSISSHKRQIEVLAVRFLLKTMGISRIIRYSDSGKPLIDNGFISISHSDDLIGFIWHPDKVCGIDIEPVSIRMKRIAQKAFSESEISMYGYDPEKLTLLWCCKETIYKMSDLKGLSFKDNINIISVSEDKSVDCRLIYRNKDYKIMLHYTKELNNVICWGISHPINIDKH